MTPTEVHADFSERVVLQTNDLPWHPSPAPGVKRRFLDRIGDEVARATSIVAYAANSRFDAHAHGAGEEFLVLDGTFRDEHGEYPKGTYVRNPWRTQHAPFTESGCVLFVKLRQMDPTDQRRIVVDAEAPPDFSGPGAGLRRKLLHALGNELVTMEHWADGASSMEKLVGGAEILLLSGTLEDRVASAKLTEGTWLRLPPGGVLDAVADGHARFWMKRGHLPAARSSAADRAHQARP